MRLFGYEVRREKRGTTVDSLLAVLRTGKQTAVTERSIYYLPTVWRCIEIISTSIAGLPVSVKRRRNGVVEYVSHSVDRLLKIKANPYMTSQVWKELAVRDVVSRGEHFSLIERSGSVPIALYPVHYDDVDVQLNGNNLVYIIKRGQTTETFMDYEMLHVKGASLDGIRGMSMLEFHRRSMQTALSASQYIKDFFENNATPKGILSYEGKFDTTRAKDIREAWQRLYGLGSTESIAVLDQGAKFETVSLPPADALYLEIAQYTDKQICNIYGVPMHMVNDMTDAHYNNIESSGIELVKYTLMATINRFEAEIGDKLLTEAQKIDHFVDFNVDGLMRGDMKARAEYYTKLRQIEVLSANDVRKLENMNPIEGGDVYANPNINTKNENNTGN